MDIHSFRDSLLPGLDFLGQHAVAFLVAGLLTNLVYTRYATNLRRFPGPFLASFTRAWQVWVAWTGHAEKHYMAAHKKYGPVVRIGPNEVSFATPAAASAVFKTGQGFHKTEFYRVFLPGGINDIFTETREHVHAVKKRFAVPPYSLATVQQHNEQIDQLLRKFVDKLDAFEASEQNAVADLGEWLHFFAFDLLGVFAFAQSFGFLDAGVDQNDTIATMAQSIYETGMMTQVPFLEPWTRQNPIWKYLPAKQDKIFFIFNMCGQIMKKFSAMDDKADPETSSCLIRSLIESARANPDKFDNDDVFAIAMGAIGAGSDSTASTMQSFCWNVLNNSRVHEKLTVELTAASLSEIVQYSEAQSLPYFQACLKEVFRLEPAVGFNMTRSVPKGGAEIDGTYLEGGTQVALNGWVVHRDTATFGDDAEVFRPERWLEASEAKLKAMERAMIHFGGGSHVCIGRHLALFEMSKTLPTLFKRYDMKLVEPGKPLDHRTGFFLHQKGLRVLMRKRGEDHT